MESLMFGGNFFKQLTLFTGINRFASGVYDYLYFQTRAEEIVHFHDLSSYTVYCLKKSPPSSLEVVDRNLAMEEGDALQVEGDFISLSVRGGPAELLVAGVTQNRMPGESKVIVIPAVDIYRVKKPWGHELWLSDQHPDYALKQIFIKAGAKTSLQYHRFKKETNVLFSGTALLHYNKNSMVSCAEVRKQDVAQQFLESTSMIDVPPLTLHRLEAITDILLYEASTPFLDDVIRVYDDTGRSDGRISQEHSQ